MYAVIHSVVQCALMTVTRLTHCRRTGFHYYSTSYLYQSAGTSKV